MKVIDQGISDPDYALVLNENETAVLDRSGGVLAELARELEFRGKAANDVKAAVAVIDKLVAERGVRLWP